MENERLGGGRDQESDAARHEIFADVQRLLLMEAGQQR